VDETGCSAAPPRSSASRIRSRAVAPEMSAIELDGAGIQRALAGCGLQLRDVDGLLCATAQSRTSACRWPNISDLAAFIDTTILCGSSFMFHVAHAQAALQLGLCQVAVIAYGSTSARSAAVRPRRR